MNAVEDPDYDEGVLDASEFDTPTTGALSQLTSTPEAHKYAQLIMKDYMGNSNKNDQAESSLERHEKERAQAQREVARQVRERLAADKYAQSDRYLSLASAVTQPAASPAQGMGYVATAINDANRRQQTWQDAHDTSVDKTDTALADFGTGPEAYSSDLDALSLKLLQAKQAQRARMATEALRQLGRNTSPSGAQDPVARLQGLLKNMAPNDPNRKALESRIQKLNYIAPKTDPNAAIDLPAPDLNNAKLVAHYKLNPSTLLGRMTGEKRQALLDAIHDENPDWDEKGWGNLVLTRKQYTDQSGTSPGSQVRSFNTVVEHVATVLNLAKALKNGSVQMINTAKNAFKEQFGKAAPGNLRAAVQLVGPEVAKSIAAGQTGVDEREIYNKLLGASSSPDQFVGKVNEVVTPLMVSKLKFHRDAFAANLPPGADPSEQEWFDKHISPAAWSVLDPSRKPSVALRSAADAPKVKRSAAAQAALDAEMEGVQ